MEKILEQILEKLNSLDSKVSNIETDIKLIKTQQSENGEILQAVRHAQETQKAQLDQLNIELAKQSGEQKESFEALANMYGQHQFEIAKLKQVK